MQKSTEQKLRQLIREEILKEGFGTKVRVGKNIISIGTGTGQVRIYDKTGEKLVAQFTRDEFQKINDFSKRRSVD